LRRLQVIKDLPPRARWVVRRSENELDRSKNISVANREFVVRCAPRFEGYVLPDLPQLGHRLDSDLDETQTVRFRIDDGPLRSQSWALSSDFAALFPPPATLRQIVRGKKLILEYKPDYVVRQTMTIDLAGLSDAMAEAGCAAVK
jgi:hypothetical protein